MCSFRDLDSFQLVTFSEFGALFIQLADAEGDYGEDMGTLQRFHP